MPFGGLASVAAIQAGTSLIGSLFGASAASRAAQQQAQAAQYASDLAGQAGKDATQTIRDAQGNQTANFQKLQDQTTGTYQTLQNNLNPFLQTGTQAQISLAQLLQPGGALSSTPNFVAPTDITETNDPGYQARLAAGQQALDRSAAATGGVLNAGEGKALTRYGQDYASNEYQNVYARALGAYQQNIANQTNQFNRLNTVAGTGLSAAGTLGGLGTAFNAQQGTNTGTFNSQLGQDASGVANVLTGTAATQGADLTGKGNALAAGTVGSANAINAGLGGVANALTPISLYSLFQGSTGGYPSGYGPATVPITPAYPSTTSSYPAAPRISGYSGIPGTVPPNIFAAASSGTP